MEYIEDIHNLFKSNPDPFGWAEISYQHDTGRGYQHPQDLKADFINKFTHLVEHRVNWFWEQKGYINYSQLEELIYQFRKHFPTKSRLPNILYFDDHIQNLIDKYKQKDSNKNLSVKEQNTDLNLHLVDADNQNHFNLLSRRSAEDFFMQLATTKNKDGKPYLTIKHFREFTDRAFGGKPFTEKLTINTGYGDTGKVISLFYLFYNYCTNHKPGIGVIDSSSDNRDKYIRLLTDHFDNWPLDEVKQNFRCSKPEIWEDPS